MYILLPMLMTSWWCNYLGVIVTEIPLVYDRTCNGRVWRKRERKSNDIGLYLKMISDDSFWDDKATDVTKLGPKENLQLGEILEWRDNDLIATPKGLFHEYLTPVHLWVYLDHVWWTSTNFRTFAISYTFPTLLRQNGQNFLYKYEMTESFQETCKTKL